MPARAIDGGLVLVEHVGVVVLAVVAQDVGELTEAQFSPRPHSH